CADFFRYSGSGEILPTNEPGKQGSALTTIDKLGLNIDKLKNMRSQAIDGILQAMDGLTIEDIQILAQSYVQPDAEGKYTPFCTVIAYYMKNYFNI
ncbi:MAG TPA: TIGR02646 family protein, partial [Kamptonema sp.]|nr:TIGR02646 family protein [Kamptonema sp.]